MRKLIRNQATGAFLMRNAQWTGDIALAHDFTEGNPELLGSMKEYEIYYSFDETCETSYDFWVPHPFKDSVHLKSDG